MRTRQEITEDIEIQYWSNGEIQHTSGTPVDQLILETLLDIRELLQNPPIEITGVPLQDSSRKK